MEVTADQVEQAVVQFYADPNGKSSLNAWLTHAQHSCHAWNFAWALLDKSKPKEVQFFGGNTIYIKVSRHWHEVPKEQYASLRIRLLNEIVQHSDTRYVMLRIIKALAAYVLLTIEPTWKTAIDDLITMFTDPQHVEGIGPTTALDILFTILMCIADELEMCHDTMRIRSSNKNVIRDLLRSSSPSVLNLCQQVMEAPQISNHTKELVLKTLNSWLQSLSLPLMDTKHLLISLISYSHYGLLCEGVLECLKTAITDTGTHVYPNTVIEFIRELLALKPVLEEAKRAEDENTCALIYSLFTSILECHSSLLLKSALNENQRELVVQVITLLVDCAATPGQYPTQENISAIPFSVWYTIQDDILTFEKEQIQELNSLFTPVYLKLVEIFLAKSVMPPDGVLSSEEREIFRCYRQDICDTYMYAHNVLKDVMLICLENHLKASVARIQSDASDWRYLDAILNAYSSVAETVAEADNIYIPRFIQSIPQIPFNDNVQLISVVLTTLGSYADWLNFHQDHLQYVVPIMVAGLVNESLIGAASQALRDLTLECPVTIVPFSQPILYSCQKTLHQMSQLGSAETERIVTIFSRILSAGMNHDSVCSYLEDTLTPFITRITQLKDKMVNSSLSVNIQAQPSHHVGLESNSNHQIGSNSGVNHNIGAAGFNSQNLSHSIGGLGVTPPPRIGVYSNGLTHGETQELAALLKLFSCLARHLNLDNDVLFEDDECEVGIVRQVPNNLSDIKTQPLLLVLEPMMPIVAGVAEHSRGNSEIVENLCKLLKNSITTLRLNFVPILPVTLQIIPTMFQQSFNPTVLEVVKQLIIFFGPDQPYRNNMALLLRVVVETTLSRTSNNNLWSNTDVVYGCLALLAASIKKVPYLIPVNILEDIFRFGIDALKLPEEPTLKAASVFFCAFLVHSRSNMENSDFVQFQRVVAAHVLYLVRTICYFTCTAPRHSLGAFSDILSSLCKLYGDDLLRALDAIQREQNFPSPTLTPDQKTEFVKRIMRNRGNRRKILEAVSDLALMSRGIGVSEYSNQTAPFI